MLVRIFKARIRDVSKVCAGQGLILQRDVSGRNVVDDSVTPGIRFENPGKVLIDIADEGIVIRRNVVAGHIQLQRCSRIPHHIVVHQPVARAVVQVNA